jgi:hypothetical protein
LTLAGMASAQEEGLLGYVRDDLQLISQQSLPGWSPRWTGPIEAATILAWYTENGYSRFVRDLNGDGVIDELDTIELADDLGQLPMATETPRGTTDARLVLGLAQYVAGIYPNEFVLKIYDASFPSEVAAEGLGPFSPTMIPGILLDLKTEPTIAAYELEMEGAEGVILGLDADAGANNTYLAGRSFLYDLTSEGYTPIDLAWAEEDRWQAGYQGQVLETVGWMSDRFMLDFRGQWKPVEFMLALSPLRQVEANGTPEPCPENAIAYDVTENTTPYGRIIIAECVTRETIIGGPTLDTYTYSVTNVDYQYGSCGICLFHIQDLLGATTVDMSGPAFWMAHAGWGGWWWRAPSSSCGILPGDTGVFSFTVIGPTSDTWVSGSVSGCAAGVLPTIAALQIPSSGVRTTGPGKWTPDDGDQPGSDCPDLTVEIKSATCTLDAAGGGYEVLVTATITNIGGATANSIHVHLNTASDIDTDLISSLAPGASADADFVLTYGANQRPDCPLDFTVEADPYHTITECNEDNNVAEGSVACPRCQ